MSEFSHPVKTGRVGRPKGEINLALVARSAAIGCTIAEIAAVLGMTERHLFERMQQQPEIKEIIERARETGKTTLRRMQWQGAESGNATMLIWLGKQLLDQKDRASTEITGKISLEHLVLQAAGLITDEKKD